MNPIIYTGFKASMFTNEGEIFANFFNINTDEFVDINFGSVNKSQAKTIKKALSGNFVIIDTTPNNTILKRYFIRTKYSTYEIEKTPDEYRVRNCLSISKKLMSYIGIVIALFITASFIPEHSHWATTSNFLTALFNPILLCLYGMAGAEFFFYRDERNSLKDILKKAFSKENLKEDKPISNSQWLESLNDLKGTSNINDEQREKVYAAINHSDLSSVLKEEYKHVVASQDKLSYKFLVDLENNYQRITKIKIEKYVRG